MAAVMDFHQTPRTIAHRFTFDADEVTLDMDHNLRWGETQRPRLVGKLAAR